LHGASFRVYHPATVTDGHLRTLAWAAIGLQIAFVASWVVAGAMEPGYSHVDHYISELAAADAAHPGIVMAGLAGMGVSMLALAAGLTSALPSRRALPAMLMGAAGATMIVVAFTRLDCTRSAGPACQRLRDAGALSNADSVHSWASLAVQLFLLFTPFAIARALWPSPAGLAALFGGSLGVLFATAGIGLLLLGSGDEAGGLVQRVGFVVIQTWLVIVAAGILWHARAPTARPATSAGS
jgi:hypothetical protein